MPSAAASYAARVDDGENIRIASQQDFDSFAALYRLNIDPIYRFCYRRLRSKEAAEDATAQVFAKAFANLPNFRGGSFQGWLFAIANHVVIDEGRVARLTAPLVAAVDVVDPAPGPEDEALAVEKTESFLALLSALPPEQRRVLELRLAGLSGVEIAQALGRSHDTVRNLQHRALVRLRDLLGVTTTAPGRETDA
jgi:RNA polymerase sigma-70 factor (ECF subfamily)